MIKDGKANVDQQEDIAPLGASVEKSRIQNLKFKNVKIKDLNTCPMSLPVE